MKKQENHYYLRSMKIHKFLLEMNDEAREKSVALQGVSAVLRKQLEATDLVFFKSVRNHVIFFDLPEEIRIEYQKGLQVITVNFATIAKFDSLSPKDYTGRSLARQIATKGEYVFIDSKNEVVPIDKVRDLLHYDLVPSHNV